MAGPIAFYASDPIQSTQLIPGGNTPASGAQLFVYLPGTTTKQNSYTDASASTARTNPIVLDSGGNIPGNGEVWIASTAKFVLAPSNDTDPPGSPYWTRDNVPGINNISSTQVLTTVSEWILGPTPTFVGTNSFTVAGDQTSLFTLGRRIKATVTGGDRFGIVTSSVFGALTTVGITLDSSTLNAGLSTVSYGILSTPNGSVPWTVLTSTGLFFESPVTTGALLVTSSALIFGNLTASSAVSASSSALSVRLLTVTSTGTFQNLVDISSSTAGQIKFPVVQNATSDPNTLDAYTESTWVPSLGGNATYAVQNGNFTKIGNLVFIQGAITVNTIGTGSTSQISGLPLQTGGAYNISLIIVSSATSIVSASATLPSANTVINITSRTVSSASEGVNPIFQSSTTVNLAGFYRV